MFKFFRYYIDGYISEKTNLFFTSLLALSIALVTFFIYRDILDYFFFTLDATYCMFSFRINSLQNIANIFVEPWYAGFYRPITALTYAIDYAVWGFNPFGWYLTNLILHILVSVLVFYIVLSFTKGNLFISWFSAIIFTIHPIHVTVVPVIVFRTEPITAIFILLSLLLFMKYIFTLPAKKTYLYFSLFFCALALGAKEIGIVTPFTIFTYYIVVYSNEETYKDRIVKSLKVCLPFIILTFLYLLWRTYLVHGIGGYWTGIGKTFFIIENSKKYFLSLVKPVNLQYLRYITLFFIIIMLFYKQEIKEYLTILIHTKLVVFLLIWMFLPLGVYILTIPPMEIFRLVYIPVIPFSVLLSIVFVNNLQSTIKKTRKSRLSLAKSFMASVISFGLMVFLFIYSPVIKSYNRPHENASKICKTVFNKLMEIVPKLPVDATIYVYNLPSDIYSKGITPLPHGQGMCFFDSNYQKFLSYYYPDKRIKVIAVPDHTEWNTYADHSFDINSEIKFEVREKNSNNVELDIKLTTDKIKQK